MVLSIEKKPGVEDAENNVARLTERLNELRQVYGDNFENIIAAYGDDAKTGK